MVAVGTEMNGDTVNGIWASNGWGSLVEYQSFALCSQKAALSASDTHCKIRTSCPCRCWHLMSNEEGAGLAEVCFVNACDAQLLLLPSILPSSLDLQHN